MPSMIRTTAFCAAAALLVALTGCGGGDKSSTSTTTTTSSSTAAGGTITAQGSTALLPLVKQAAQEYQAAHSDVKISVAGGGSKVGLTQVAAKSVDIGDSDIPASGDQAGLVDHKVAVVTFAVITHPAAGVKNLTSAQIRDIFSGKISNWKQAGGADQKITLINRPKSSGTRAVFVSTVMGNAQPSENALTQDSSGTVVTTVAQTPGSVSYVSTGYLKGKPVTAVAIDGNAPNNANVTGGKYKFWSYEHMYTNGAPAKPVADFIDYVTKDAKLLNQLSFTPVDAMKSK